MSLQSECSPRCRAMALSRHPPAPGSPAVSRSVSEPAQQPRSEAGRAAVSGRCGSGQTCSSLLQHGPGKQQQQHQHQQQSPVLYSPTSALQNACCGWTGAQLHASASSSDRHRTSSASVQRMPLTANGILETLRRFFQPLRCCLLRRCVAV